MCTIHTRTHTFTHALSLSLHESGNFFLQSCYKGIWDEEKEKALLKKCRKDVLKQFTKSEKEKAPSVLSLFDDVLDDVPLHLENQKRYLNIDRVNARVLCVHIYV